MIIKQSKKEKVQKRHFRIRKKISGTKELPRLSFYRSNKHVYAQLIDDVNASTIVSCSTLHPVIKKEIKSTWNRDAAKKIGEILGRDALSKGYKKVIFDRGGNIFHGKVMAFADGARSAGLEF